MNRIVVFGWPGIALIIIFIVGLIVVLGFMFRLLFTLLPAIILILIIYFLFRSLNNMKGKR
ncbi:MAG TPA: hypothetical protein VJB66_04615 [Candidatus Nanoarchaeia archaeon]|nr:hypothetical protein [Candidatus Nanoarchaeia archaeon]